MVQKLPPWSVSSCQYDVPEWGTGNWGSQSAPLVLLNPLLEKLFQIYLFFSCNKFPSSCDCFLILLAVVFCLTSLVNCTVRCGPSLFCTYICGSCTDWQICSRFESGFLPLSFSCNTSFCRKEFIRKTLALGSVHGVLNGRFYMEPIYCSWWIS